MKVGAVTSRFKIFPAQLWMAKSRILIKSCSERSCVPSQCEKSSLALRKRISKAFRSGDWLGSQEAGKAFNSNWKSAPALWPPTTRAKSILAWEYIVFSNLLNSAEGGKNRAWILWQPKSEAKLDTIDSQRDTRTCTEQSSPRGFFRQEIIHSERTKKGQSWKSLVPWAKCATCRTAQNLR